MVAYLPVPRLLTAEGNNEVADNLGDDILNHGKQPHPRLPDILIFSSLDSC